jgi:2-methylcitrate dehydratase PrpD
MAPRTYHEAQVSLPYSVAVALIEGKALLAQYTNSKLGNREIRRLMDLTRIETDAKLPRGVSCHTTMTMRSGEKYVSQVDFPKGSIENPMSDDELRGKFESLAVPVIGELRTAQICDAVSRIERCTHVGELMRLTAAPAGKSKSTRRGH